MVSDRHLFVLESLLIIFSSLRRNTKINFLARSLLVIKI